MPSAARTLIYIVWLAALTGCMMGPDFHSPDAPKTKSYTKSPLSKKTASAPLKGSAGKAQHFVKVDDIPEEWWTLFRSPALNDLIKTGIAHSPNLAAAEATLRQARETWFAQIGSTMFPSVNVQGNAQRQGFALSTIGVERAPIQVFDTFSTAFNVSYTFDLFGANRRQIEAVRAQLDNQKYQMEAAYLTLTSNIVTIAINTASFREQIRVTHELIQLQADQLAIVKKQFTVGGASEADVLSQESQLAATRATLPPLQQSLAQSHHALAVLIGALPSEAQLPVLKLEELHLPNELPVSLPSALVRQRPDIRASEELLHAASAQVGVATANLLPQITLTGTYGWTNPSAHDLFDPRNVVWSLASGITQPIFAGGSLRAKQRAAVAGFDAAAAQYKQTVLQAFQNVADTLRALENDAKTLRAQRQAEVAAEKSLQLTQKQFQLGGVSYTTLLTAQKQYQQTKINRVQAEAQRFTDTAVLFQALGGGWWNRKGKES
ncbi:MAG: efflux transporter outer membrane subunit [Proteobacteria bacterium]|nr:efflux transporter outer membrane subunit [Pseudomonadota bacterium]